jgi:hypothetical protein
MELFEVYTELAKFLKATEAPPMSLVGTARGVLRQGRYVNASEPASLLAADIEAAVRRLPEPDRGHLEWLLRMNEAASSVWSKRADKLKGFGNRAGVGEYGYRLLTLVAYDLIRLWEAEAAQTAANPLERISYEQSLEIHEDDYRINTLTRTLTSQVTTPTLRYAILPYYYTVGPVPPDAVEMLESVHHYVGSVPEPLGSDTRWWAHIIQLDRTYRFGETVTIAMRETYTDVAERLHTEHPEYGLHLLINIFSTRMERISLAIKLPTELRASARPEARRANPPLWVPVELADCPIDEDGWSRFKLAANLQAGSQYGLFFPGTRLYP